MVGDRSILERDVITGTVGLVTEHPVWSTATPDPDTGHHRLEGHRVMALPRGDDPRDRPGAGVGGQVNLGGQAAAGVPQSDAQRPDAPLLAAALRSLPSRSARGARRVARA